MACAIATVSGYTFPPDVNASPYKWLMIFLAVIFLIASVGLSRAAKPYVGKIVLGTVAKLLAALSAVVSVAILLTWVACE